MYPLFSSIVSNLFLNHLLVYVMPGEGIELGEPMTVDEARTKRPPIVLATEKSREDPMTGFGVSDAEARTLVSYVAMTGVVYPLASVMTELPDSRVQLLKVTMPTLPVMPICIKLSYLTCSHGFKPRARPPYRAHIPQAVGDSFGVSFFAYTATWGALA
jgi:hypothetical protein